MHQACAMLLLPASMCREQCVDDPQSAVIRSTAADTLRVCLLAEMSAVQNV